MSNSGKKLLASLMGIHLNEEVPKLESLVPQRVSNQIMSGQLPKFNPSTIILGQNESCHFMDRAALAIKKTEKSYQSRRNGRSYRLTKGFTIHSSNANTKPVVQEWYEYKIGIVFVTNKRIIFVSPENGFEKKVRNLTAVIPYSNAVSLQFNSQILTLMLPQAQFFAEVLRMIH